METLASLELIGRAGFESPARPISFLLDWFVSIF